MSKKAGVSNSNNPPAKRRRVPDRLVEAPTRVIVVRAPQTSLIGDLFLAALTFTGAAAISIALYSAAIGETRFSGAPDWARGVALRTSETLRAKFGGAPAAEIPDPPTLAVASPTEVQPLNPPVAQPSAATALSGPPSPFPHFDREHVLADVQSRVSADFRVPQGLHDRVGFWFDVYSKWDSNKRIIHDSRHPWIVYKVVDVYPIINAAVPSHRWMRNEKANRTVSAETDRVRRALANLVRARSLDTLSADDRALVAPLSALGGNIVAAAKLARDQVRVQTGQRDFFMSGLAASPEYLGTMERIFQAHGLPKELTRLPFVESSFNKAATSKVGASGIWQLMGGIGAKFLIVDSNIDERRSPYKATDAAARLLKENHLILYRSWPLAVTAWNHGPGGVRKAIAGAGSRDLATILERFRTKHFDFASSNFYCEFLGALHAESYKDAVFGPIETLPALNSFFIALPRSIRSHELMRLTGLTRQQFTQLNPDLDRAIGGNAAVPRGYRLHIPSSIKDEVESALTYGTRSAARAKSQAPERT